MKAATQLSESLKSRLPRSLRNRHLNDSLNCLPWPAAPVAGAHGLSIFWISTAD